MGPLGGAKYRDQFLSQFTVIATSTTYERKQIIAMPSTVEIIRAPTTTIKTTTKTKMITTEVIMKKNQPQTHSTH